MTDAIHTFARPRDDIRRAVERAAKEMAPNELRIMRAERLRAARAKGRERKREGLSAFVASILDEDIAGLQFEASCWGLEWSARVSEDGSADEAAIDKLVADCDCDEERDVMLLAIERRIVERGEKVTLRLSIAEKRRERLGLPVSTVIEQFRRRWAGASSPGD